MRILIIVYDNESRVHVFPTNIAYISAILKNKHDVHIYSQDIYHYDEQHLTDFLDKVHFDMVCVGVIGGYFQFKKLLKISDAINTSKNRPKYYVLGGHGPSPEPEFFLQKTGADIVVKGEGEETIKELADELYTDLSSIKGISYRDGDKFFHNEERPLMEIDSIPWPDYDSFKIEYYKTYPISCSSNTDSVMSVSASRGCIFKCNFCYRMDKGYRLRKPTDVVNEIRFLNKKWNINFINFIDELLMSNKDNIYEICEGILSSGMNLKWYCNGRLNFAKPKVLSLMKKAGCVFINYGVESADDYVLKMMNKNLNIRIIEEGVQNTIDAGIVPGINIIFGNIGDTEETLEKGVNLMLKYFNDDEMRTVRPVTPYPGSELYYYAIEKGLLDGPEDFYNKHINSDLMTVNFTTMSDEDFYKCLYKANQVLVNRFNTNKADRYKDTLHSLYFKKDANFRGFRN